MGAQRDSDGELTDMDVDAVLKSLSWTTNGSKNMFKPRRGTETSLTQRRECRCESTLRIEVGLVVVEGNGEVERREATASHKVLPMKLRIQMGREDRIRIRIRVIEEGDQ